MTLNYRIYGDSGLLVPNITDESGIEGIKAIESYKQRVLSVMNKNDFAFMPQNTRGYNITLSEIYKELGVNFINPDNIFYVDYSGNITTNILDVYAVLPKELEGRKVNLFPFINSEKIDSLSRLFGLETCRNHHSSEIINDKSTAQQELRDLGVLTPEGKTIYSEQQSEHYFKELKYKGYESITIKLKRAASGMGVFKINTIDELEKKLYEHRGELNEGLLMDGWIKGEFINSPNIQFNIGKTPEEDVFIGCSSQILSPDGTVHLGNISDMGIMENKKLVEDLLIIRNWIRSKKAYGISGIDFSIFEDKNGEQKAYFMEINGRINGSTHGAIIANKVFGDNDYLDKWSVINNIMLKKGTTIDQFIAKLQRDKIYFDPSTKTGVIPTNISAIDKYGKAMVVNFGEKSRIMETIDILNSY